MTLENRLIEEMKQAMKKGDKLRLDVIRLLRAAIKNVEIDKGKINDEGIQTIVQQQVKQWTDALEDYKKGERQDLIEETQQKIRILQEYLPQQLDDAELKKIIIQVKEEAGMDQLGPLIGKVKQEVGNKAEGNRIATLARDLLNN
jgi:hypothetical protein